MFPILGLHLHLLMSKESVHQEGDPFPAKIKKKSNLIVYFRVFTVKWFSRSGFMHCTIWLMLETTLKMCLLKEQSLVAVTYYLKFLILCSYMVCMCMVKTPGKWTWNEKNLWREYAFCHHMSLLIILWMEFSWSLLLPPSKIYLATGFYWWTIYISKFY